MNVLCSPGVCDPGESHDLVPGELLDQNYLIVKKLKKYVKEKKIGI